MAQLQIVMAQSDVIAAIQAWCTANGHQMNATVAPALQGSTGTFTLTVELNS
jgi:hypothetical protein